MSYCEVDNFVPISNLVARVQMMLPDASATIIEAALREQAIVFADNTKAFEITVYEDAQENVSEYPVTLPGCLEPRIIRSVAYNGVCYSQLHGADCNSDSGSCGCGTGACRYSGGMGSGFIVETPSWIKMYPAPGEDAYNAIKIVAVAGVSASACELPADMVSRWGSHIVNGALSVLYGMKNEKWYAASNVDRYAAMARQGVNDAKRDVALAATGGTGIPIGGDPWVL